jgi:HSP20 family protein
MRLIRYQESPLFSPARSFTDLRDEMDRLFDAAFPALSSLQRDGYFGAGDFPVDLYQEKDAFLVRAELPGFRREDLSVEVNDGLLTITGHRKTDAKAGEKEAKADGVTGEWRVTRTISLPEQVKVDAIEAKYEHGILAVTLPKVEEAKPRQIAIDVK